ncbi:MAG: prenyltransferase/squalene oxidase repeat-containing protein [Promethearchaeota archaeon]
MHYLQNQIRNAAILWLFIAMTLAVLPSALTPISAANALHSSSIDSPIWSIGAPSSGLQASHPLSTQAEIQSSEIPFPNELPTNFALGNLLVLYGDYVNESGQESIEIWIAHFNALGFNTSTSHIDSFTQSSDFDLIVVTPSVGTSDESFGVSLVSAQAIGSSPQPILLLGYAHEVLDRLQNFHPVTAFIPCIERYLWPPDAKLQIFSLPHTIPFTDSRFSLYSEPVSYDAYRISSLPTKVEVLGTNYDGTGAQLLWFRAHSGNPHIYYWGINQASKLNSQGWQMCENLIHWLIRPTLQQRLGETLAAWQLQMGMSGDYWETQGAGGFGYPLEPSLRLSYYVTDMMTTHGLALNLSTFGVWLQSRYNITQGCFEDLASVQLHDRCITTAMSVLMADRLGILNQLNQAAISAYLASCQDLLSGGFFTEYGATHTSLTATRFALEALAVLGQLSTINLPAAVVYIANCQELNPLDSEFGGFYSSDAGGISASLVEASHALVALKVVSELNAINQTALRSFIGSCEDPAESSIFDTKYTLDSDEWVLGTACALQLLTILDAQSLYDTSAGRAYIMGNQYPNGGWGRGDYLHDFHNSPDETWYCASALGLTGGLGVTESNLIQYLTSCLTEWGGATEPAIFGDFLTSVEIIMALAQVDALQSMNITAFLSFLENCWSPSRTSFVAHQLPFVVGTDTDSSTPDRIALETCTFGPLYHYMYSQLVPVLNLTTTLWTTRASQLRQEIINCQSSAAGYYGMLGLHHLYVGHESDWTFRFDTTCWNLLAHQSLGGTPAELNNATAALAYLVGCLQTNVSHQYFRDLVHTIPISAQWREAEGYLAETWLGVQAYRYLNPSMSDLDGQRLASYAAGYLHENSSLITTYYATEILYFLVETGLNPDALTLLDWDGVRGQLLERFTYHGLFIDSSLPLGKWMPHLINLGVQLIDRLQLRSHLDVNPILNLTQFTYPTGILSVGTNFEISASIIEMRWAHLPDTIFVKTAIFNISYLESCSQAIPGYYELQDAVPVSSSSLGPQDLSIIAYAPGAIPHFYYNPSICLGWGTLALQTKFTPSAMVPRSIPVNVTVKVGLAGSENSTDPLGMGEVTITVETTSDVYPTSLQAPNQYSTTIETQQLAPITHLLRINASIPYCTPHTETVPLSVVVFDTHLTLEQILPTTPVLFDPTTIVVGLWNDSGTPLEGYQVAFNVTRPGESAPFQTTLVDTNTTGLALCSWEPAEVGPWQIDYRFQGQDMYAACQSKTVITVNRRTLVCNISQPPPSSVFIGNQSSIEVEVSDELNGSQIPYLVISIYEDDILLTSNTTDANGRAICQWFASAPVGVKTIHIEIMGTTTHAPFLSAPFDYLIRDTAFITLTSNTTQVYIGESLIFEVLVTTSTSDYPNGTASIYWDGAWRQDILITQGTGTILLSTSYSELVGEHLVIVRFGHLDAPDFYSETSAAFKVTLQGIITPNLTLAINPLEVDDAFLQPTLEIIIRLSYRNGSSSYGLVANLSIHLYSQEGSLLANFTIWTNLSGIGQLTITTPLPGIYSVTAYFEGQHGFAPTSATTPFLVRPPHNPIVAIFSPLLLSSLAVMITGLILGALLFKRLQNRLNSFLERLQPIQDGPISSMAEIAEDIDQPPRSSENIFDFGDN